MIDCLACGSTNLANGAEKSVFDKTITIYRCNSCDLVFSHPLPTKSELQEYYRSGKAQSHSGFDLNYLIEKHEGFVKNPPFYYRHLKDFFLKTTSQLSTDGACLEIGCNLGVFIELVQSSSHLKFYGIEFNSQAVDFVRSRGKFMIESKSIEDNPFPGIQFDCIIMFDVLEHIPDQIQFIEVLRKRLNPQGMMLLSVPNAKAWSYKLLRLFKKLRGKEIFPTVEPPFHLYGYSCNNLKRIFEHHGFEMIFYEFGLMEHFDIQHETTQDISFNFNREIGNILSRTRFLTRDDKLIAAFRKTR